MRLKTIVGIGVLLVLISCQPEQKPEVSPTVEYLTSDTTATRPYSDAVRVGHMLYLSGQIGIDSDTKTLVPGGIKVETRQAMENIKRILEMYGSSLDKVVKCTVMLADIRDYADMNTVYVTYFPEHLPARSTFGASGLAFGARVEIECWAIVE